MVPEDAHIFPSNSVPSILLILLIPIFGCAARGVVPPKGYVAPDELYVGRFVCRGLVTQDVADYMTTCLADRLGKGRRFQVHKVEGDTNPVRISRHLVLRGEFLDMRVYPYVEGSKRVTGCLLTPLSLAGVDSAMPSKKGAVAWRIDCRIYAEEFPGRRCIFSREYKVSETCYFREGELLVNKSCVAREAVNTMAEKIALDFLNALRR